MIVTYIQEKNPFPGDATVCIDTSIGLITFVKGENDVNDQLVPYLKAHRSYQYALTQGYLKEGSAPAQPEPTPPPPAPVEVNTETATGGLTGVPSDPLSPTTPPAPTDTASGDVEGGTQPTTGKLNSPVILDVSADKQDDGETIFVRVDFETVEGATAYKLQYAPTTRSSYTVAGETYTESPIEFELPTDYKSVVVRLTALGDGTNTSNSDADISQTLSLVEL